MPKASITFQDVGVTIKVPAGTRLIEVSEKVGSGINYVCREGECCTCLTRIVSGHEHFAAPSVLEEQVLKDNLAPRHHRLACQAQVLGGVIVVKPAA
jgi:ferredoxin